MLLLGSVMLAVLAASCGKAPAGPPGGAPGGAGGPPPAMPVSVLEARVQSVPSTLEAVGTLEGMREVEVRARVSGVLQKQLFREGESVRAGSALYRIEQAPYAIAQDAARAAVVQQEARVEQAQRESKRLAALIADRAISQREADDAGSQLKTAEAALQAARAQLREAQLSLGYTQVTAPIGGIAQRSQRSEGALVSPADPTPLTTLVQTDPIRVRFALSQDEAKAIRAAARNGGAQVRLLGEDGRPAGAPGKLDFAGATVDPRLGTVAMRAELPNPEGRWLPGQFVRVQIASGTQQGVLVPQAAVMSGDQGRFVWLIGPEGTAQPRPVQTGGWQGPDWVLKDGLKGGEKVIVDNLMKLRPGAPVQAKAPPGASGGAGGPGGSAASGGAAPPAPGGASAPAAPSASAPAASGAAPAASR